MQYDVGTPEEYLEKLEPDWRKEKLLALRQLIRSAAPGAVEAIHYKMLGYHENEDYLFHLNAQRGYVSLYVGNVETVDPRGELLKNVSLGKGCIRFKKSVKLEETGVEAFLSRYMELREAGKDLGC